MIANITTITQWNMQPCTIQLYLTWTCDSSPGGWKIICKSGDITHGGSFWKQILDIVFDVAQIQKGKYYVNAKSTKKTIKN